MKYLKHPPATTYIIQNSVTVPQKTGPSLFYNGIYLKFNGNPPEANTEATAIAYVRDEVKMRRVKMSDFDLKVKEVDKQIQATLENTEDYIQGRIWRSDGDEGLKQFALYKCPLCKEARVFQNEVLFAEHLTGEHGIKKVAMPKKEDENQPEAS